MQEILTTQIRTWLDTARPMPTTTAERRLEAAKSTFDARMKAAQWRFEQETASIRAAFVAEVAGIGR
jgi:hypothetical protein